MTPSDSADHSADLSADYSATLQGQFLFADHGFSHASADSADYVANSATHAHAQNKFGKGRHGSALAGTDGTFDPADAYRTKAARRAAWAAWEQAGAPWPPPAGLVSAALSSCRNRNRDGFR